jgi:hypothetical protein
VNVNLLIDALVRQTTVLIAQLATAAGARAALAHTANQVFMDLVSELKEQGLGNKVIADMFGLSLRTYHNRIARLSESTTDRGRSLWEAMLSHVQEHGPLSRAEVLGRFARDDEASVKGVLKDLVDSGMIFRAGRGDFTTYQAASVGEGSREALSSAARTAPFVWLVIYRHGALTRGELGERVAVHASLLDEALELLVKEQRVRSLQRDGVTVYESDECVVAFGDPAGWEAAVFDHYQAMAAAVAAKLRLGRTQAQRGEWIGGSTYSFDLWEGHPLHDEVVALLQQTRERAAGLRRQVEAYNAEHPTLEASRKVYFYAGQNVIETDDVTAEDDE